MNIRNVYRFPVLLAAAALVVATGCEQIKSSTPLSPSIAGPIAGVTITAPSPIEPRAGRQIKDTEQPIALVIGNADSNSVRPYTMAVQIAATPSFDAVVFSQTGITPSPDGTTALRLPDRLQTGRIYYWRAIADDGANSSGWTDPVPFEVLRPVVIGRPEPLAPIGNVLLTGSAAQLRVRNGESSGPHGPLYYTFQVAPTQSFSAMIINSTVNEDDGETTFQTPPLAQNQQLFWRVRIDNGGTAGEWSRTESFRSGVLVIPGPSLPSGPVNPGNCASSDGRFIAACIGAKYPDLRRAGVSLSTRVANMEFLRDRMIEAGICGGLDLARNRKRNGSELSIDAIAQRTGGRTIVVDIARGYDDTGDTLELQWLADVGGEPGWQPDLHPTCN